MVRKIKQNKINRREFLYGTAVLGTFAVIPRNVIGGTGRPAPSDRLNIAGIGVGGQGAEDIKDAAYNNNVYALCDVDEDMAGATFVEYPEAKLYRDFRKLLDKEYRNIDAVTIATPDHNHAMPALWAMERQLNVYLEAPLAQTVWEARQLTAAAAKYNVATQMGNQGYSSEATRIAAEVIWAGDIGEVTEVHAWNTGSFAQDIAGWPLVEAIPTTLQWDLWVGRAAKRTYSPDICPYGWRGFQNYGTGILGDQGIHLMGSIQWALQLDSPVAVQSFKVDGRNEITYANGAAIKYDFGQRGTMPPISVYWYGGNQASVTHNPAISALAAMGNRGNNRRGAPVAETAEVNNAPAPAGQRGAFGGARGGRGAALPYMPEGMSSQSMAGCNVMFVGTKGYLCTGGRGETVTFIPKSKIENYKIPTPTIARSPGHMDDWLEACRNSGRKACSDFSISGPFTEWVLLGNIAERFDNRLEWDTNRMQFSNDAGADEYVKPMFRQGWEIEEV